MSGPDDERAGSSGEHPDGPEVGSLGEETAKLLGALAGWAREQDVAGHVAAFAEGRRDDGDASGQSTHTGPECRYCPVCRAANAVRGISPEVRTHLTVAVTSLARAAEALLTTDVPDDSRRGARKGGSGASRPGVEHIDLHGWDDEGPDEHGTDETGTDEHGTDEHGDGRG